jgi:undecaprenyl-diphosphatase
MNYELFQKIHGLSGHNRILDDVMIFCTNDALLVYALVLLAIWMIGNTTYKKSVLYAGGTGILALLGNFLITLVYYEPRPFVTHHVHLLVPHVADASFPSDHATGAFAISIGMWIRHRKLGAPMLIFAFLTGLSRVWVGHHYPFDVVGSLIVSVIVAAIVSKCSRFFDPIVNKVISVYEFILGKVKKSLSGHTLHS